MIQTLADVVAQQVELTTELTRRADDDKTLKPFDSVAMDGVVVLKDHMAMRWCEMEYAFNTNFVPGGLPGVGESTADFPTHDGKTYLAVDLGVMLCNMEAVHLIRPHEALYRKWHSSKETLRRRLDEFLKATLQVDAGVLATKAFGECRTFDDRVGWESTGTPTSAVVDALHALAQRLKRRRRKGTTALAAEGQRIAELLQPFTHFGSVLAQVRKTTGHKSFPHISDDMIRFYTPAASGGASMHSHCASDDVTNALPSEGDLILIAAGAGIWENVTHLGHGKLQGEHYIMLVPRTPFFETVRQRVDEDAEIVATWEKMKNFGEVQRETLSERVHEWLKLTQSIKNAVIREVVPRLITERVLGFHVDLIHRRGTALLRPVVAESHLVAYPHLIERAMLSVIRPPIESTLACVGNHYGQVKSVFD